MSSRHPDEQPEAREERDDVLENMLTGARRDLHIAVARVLDFDRGLDAILGSPPTTEHRPTSADTSRSRSARGARPRTSRVPPQESSSLAGRIESLRELLGSTPTMQAALPDLNELQEGLAERRLSRGAAVELIQKIEFWVQQTFPVRPTIPVSPPPRDTGLAPRIVGPALLVVTGMAGILWFNQATWGVVAMCSGLLLFGVATVRLRRRIARRRVLLHLQMLKHREQRELEHQALRRQLQELRWAIARLFDDSHDESIPTGPR